MQKYERDVVEVAFRAIDDAAFRNATNFYLPGLHCSFSSLDANANLFFKAVFKLPLGDLCAYGRSFV